MKFSLGKAKNSSGIIRFFCAHKETPKAACNERNALSGFD